MPPTPMARTNKNSFYMYLLTPLLQHEHCPLELGLQVTCMSMLQQNVLFVSQ